MKRLGLRHSLLCAGLAALPCPGTAQTVTDCLVQAGETADIGAASRGVLAAMHVSRADRVAAGDLLAELEASQEDANVALAELSAASDIAVRAARARAETAELNAGRLTSLAARDLVPDSEAEAAALEARSARLAEEEALFQRRVAQVELDAARAALERKRIRAPFDGVITDTVLSVGEVYTEADPVLRIAQIDPLRVEAYLPAAKRPDVALGQMAEVTLETGGSYRAEIALIDPVLDAATGTFALELTLPNPDGAILAGQSCFLDVAAE